MRYALPLLVASPLLAAVGCLDPLPPYPDGPGRKDGGVIGAGDGGGVGLEDGGPIDGGALLDGGEDPSGNDGGSTSPGDDGGSTTPGDDGGNPTPGNDGGNPTPNNDGGGDPGDPGGPGDEDAGPCSDETPRVDLTFSGDGLVDDGCGQFNNGAFRDVAVLADGSILAAGHDGRPVIMKRLADGGPDPGFLGSGACIAYTPPPSSDGGTYDPGYGYDTFSGQAVAVDGEGRILFAISRVSDDYNGDCDFSVMVRRYSASGFEDTSFGDNGAVSIPTGSSYCFGGGVSPQVADLAVDSAGNIYVATTWVEELSGTSSMPLIGVISPSGEVATWTDSGSFGHAVAVVTDSDNTALVVGTRGQGNSRQATIWRVAPSGSTTAPTVTRLPDVAPGQDYSVGLGVALDAQRRLLLAGEAANTANERFALTTRSASDGARDTSFGIEGFKLMNLGTGAPAPFPEEARGIVDDGSRVWLTAQRGADALLLRHLRDGEPDCFVQSESPPLLDEQPIAGARTLPLAEVDGIATWSGGVVVVGKAANGKPGLVRLAN